MLDDGSCDVTAAVKFNLSNGWLIIPVSKLHEKMESKFTRITLFCLVLCIYSTLVECEKIKCRCLRLCPKYHVNFTCETEGNCFSQVLLNEVTGEREKKMGCLAPEPSGKVSIFQCTRSEDRELEETNSVSCCHDRDFCNEELAPTLKPTKSTIAQKEENVDYTLVALTISSGLCILVFIIIVAWYCYRQKNPERYRHIRAKGGHIVSNHQTIQQLFENTGGSGSGLPLLVQRTIARQVEKTRRIGTGQFSCVYEAQWRGDKVAVRIFQSRDEILWLRECDFYQDMARHENILAFIASDRIAASSVTELYMITEYCPYGSLYEYLQHHSLSEQDMLKLITSLACGLAYLHIEVTGAKGKCSIAHRNLTSKGIYIKKDGVCAIGDFALAIKSCNEVNEKQLEKLSRQPTKIYMAPELLERGNHVSGGNSYFNVYVMADIYSFALVVWEIAFRTMSEGIKEPYQSPYQDMVSHNPSLDELRKVVCVEQRRPPILNRWHNDQVLRKLSRVIEECWHPSPSARLTALRIQKTFANIKKTVNTDESLQIV